LSDIGIDASSGRAILEAPDPGPEFMKAREKRTITEPGLGQTAGDPRRTAVRERAPHGLHHEEASEAPASVPPISVPPISSVPPNSGRHTRAIESVPRADRAESPVTHAANAKAMADGERIERIERSDGDVAGERIDRVDRVELGEPIPPEGGPSREMDRKPPSRPSREMDRTPPSHPIEGRPVRPSRAPEPKLGSSKPRAPTTPPPARETASVPPPRSVRPARSMRASIRVDDVGAAVKSGNDAVGVAGRHVPKIVRTRDEIAAAPIDHRAGFLLAHIDGVTPVQGLVDIAGMPEKEVHEILDRLRRLGIVTIR